MVKPRRAERKIPAKKYWILGCVVLAVALLAIPVWHFVYVTPVAPSQTEVTDIDPLCNYVSKSLKLKCVTVLAAESVFGPGNVMEGPKSDSPDEKVSFPLANLLQDNRCVVPGYRKDADEIIARLAAQRTQDPTHFDEVTFAMNRHFAAGASLPVPQWYKLVIKAGPKISEVQTITMKAQSGWFDRIDQFGFIDLLSNSGIDEQCIDNLIKYKWRVVSRAAVAGEISVILTEKSGKAVNLSAAVNNGQVQVGTDADSSIDETIKKQSRTPAVIGVEFFDENIFRESRAVLVSPKFASSGPMMIRASAVGASTGPLESSAEAPLGNSFSINKQGPTASGSCSGTRPATLALTGTVIDNASEPGRQSYAFNAVGSLSGPIEGHSGGLLAGCVLSFPAMRATVSFDNNLTVVVKADAASHLQVTSSGPYHLNVDVRDWQGRPAASADKDADRTQSMSFRLSGAGVYSVHVAGYRAIDWRGAQAVQVNDKFEYLITVGEPKPILEAPRPAQTNSVNSIPPVAPPPSQSAPTPCSTPRIYVNAHRPGNSGEEVTDPLFWPVTLTRDPGSPITLGEVQVTDLSGNIFPIESDGCSRHRLNSNEGCGFMVHCPAQKLTEGNRAHVTISRGVSDDCADGQMDLESAKLCT